MNILALWNYCKVFLHVGLGAIILILYVQLAHKDHELSKEQLKNTEYAASIAIQNSAIHQEELKNIELIAKVKKTEEQERLQIVEDTKKIKDIQSMEFPVSCEQSLKKIVSVYDQE